MLVGVEVFECQDASENNVLPAIVGVEGEWSSV